MRVVSEGANCSRRRRGGRGRGGEAIVMSCQRWESRQILLLLFLCMNSTAVLPARSRAHTHRPGVPSPKRWGWGRDQFERSELPQAGRARQSRPRWSQLHTCRGEERAAWAARQQTGILRTAMNAALGCLRDAHCTTTPHCDEWTPQSTRFHLRSSHPAPLTVAVVQRVRVDQQL